MPYANLQASLTDVQKADIHSRLESIKTDLNFLINLTPQERRAGKLGHSNYAFMAAAIEGARANPALIPPSFSMADWEQDDILYKKLMPIKQQVAALYEALDDTTLATRIECQKASYTFMRLVKIQSTANVPGIDSLLQNLESKANSRGKNKKVK